MSNDQAFPDENALVDELYLAALGRECGPSDRDAKPWLALRTVLRVAVTNFGRRAALRAALGLSTPAKEGR